MEEEVTLQRRAKLELIQSTHTLAGCHPAAAFPFHSTFYNGIQWGLRSKWRINFVVG